MSKRTLLLFLSILCGTFLSTASIALQKTPVITFNGLGYQFLKKVVGYPEGKPTIIFYTSFYDVDPLSRSLFPRLYIIQNLDIPTEIKRNQFVELKPNNISNSDLENAIPPERKGNANLLTLGKIIWVDKAKSFYAIGYMGYKNPEYELNKAPLARVKLNTQKTLILESVNGKDWNVSNDANHVIAAREIKDIVGGGSEDNPTLVALGNNGQVYYKHLQPDAVWHISDAEPFSAKSDKDSFIDYKLLTNKNMFLIVRNLFVGIEQNKTSQVKVNYFLSENGEKWKALTGPSGLSSPISVAGKDQLISETTDEIPVNSDGFYTFANNRLDLTQRSSLTVGELAINAAHTAIEFSNKIALNAECKLCNYGKYSYKADELKSAVYLPTEGKGAYYFVLKQSDFPRTHEYAWTKVDSLQALSQAQLLPLSDNQAADLSDFDDNDYLFSMNNQAYLLADEPNKMVTFKDPQIVIKRTVSDDLYKDVIDALPKDFTFYNNAYLLTQDKDGKPQLYQINTNSKEKTLINIQDVIGLREALSDFTFFKNDTLTAKEVQLIPQVKEAIKNYALTHDDSTPEGEITSQANAILYRID